MNDCRVVTTLRGDHPQIMDWTGPCGVCRVLRVRRVGRGAPTQREELELEHSLTRGSTHGSQSFSSHQLDLRLRLVCFRCPVSNVIPSCAGLFFLLLSVGSFWAWL